ncbi:MAG: VC0807 family protein [Puniceicoccaceae bacterium]
MGSANTETPRRENGFHSLLFNILLPVIILTQGDRLIENAASVLVIALAFPVGYFIWDYQRRRKANFISIIGFVSILLTGGVGLMQLPRFWFIIKETAIPAIIGLAVIGSLFTRYPLIRALVYSKEIFDVDQIQQELENRGNTGKMDKLLRMATILLSTSFFISAVMNFILASHFVKTEPKVDPVQFNAEVGAMTGWSYVVIALPSMVFIIGILYMVAHGIKKHAGLGMEEAMAPHLREESDQKEG